MALPKVNIVNYSPNQEDNKHLTSTRYQKMYIMADFRVCLVTLLNFYSCNISICYTSGFTQKNEYILCTIKVDANGTVIVKPDFNDSTRPYYVETGGFGNGKF